MRLSASSCSTYFGWRVDLILLPHTKVSDELATGKNIGMAFVESTVVISSALILFFAI